MSTIVSWTSIKFLFGFISNFILISFRLDVLEQQVIENTARNEETILNSAKIRRLSETQRLQVTLFLFLYFLSFTYYLYGFDVWKWAFIEHKPLELRLKMSNIGSVLK